MHVLKICVDSNLWQKVAESLLSLVMVATYGGLSSSGSRPLNPRLSTASSPLWSPENLLKYPLHGYIAELFCQMFKFVGFLFSSLITVRRYALHGLSYRNSVCPSVRPSVCHTPALWPHGSIYDHDFFTIW